jgi:hypothetical protein
MKQITLYSIQKIFVILCLFTLGNTYSQDKKAKDEPLFGKNITAKSKHPTTGIIRCATVEYEQYLQEKIPNRMTNAQFENWIAPLVKKEAEFRKRARSKAPIEIIKIPVVVHVIHNGEAIGTAPNITDAQVQSQITVLNQDFRKMLGTSGGTSTNPVAADIEIEFVLAKQDPNGNPTNGIDRVNMCATSWSTDDIDNIVKPATIWDPEQYMNMWSIVFTRTDLLGYAQFPNNSTLQGISEYEGSALTDGVVSAYDNFGSSDFDLGSSFLLASGYDKGRTMTHEVGHWLGLRHIWGDGNGHPANPTANPPKSEVTDCNATDYCADTPQVGYEHYDCDSTYDTCPSAAGNDMTENYMDYTDDVCMNIFTLNQKDRIMAVMNNSIRRKNLKTSTKDDPINLYANDAEVKNITDYCSAKITLCSSLPAQSNKKISLTNRGTSVLTSANLLYSIDGGTLQSQSWTGPLAQNQSTIVTLQNTTTSGILTVKIDTVNGTTDERATNNSSTISYEPLNFNYTNYLFTLQQDLWGSETRWDLKDGSGTIIYSGGPYDNSSILPALITQNWTLASNQCYTFSINDSSSDGICCEGGNGYYNIKSSDGSKTIKSGGSFVDNEITFFTTNTLSTNEFETSNEIYVHPNPTKSILTIQIPSNFGLPNRYSISNVLGQKMSQKEVSNQKDLTINTSNLSNGIYFITLVKDNQKRTLRFIKE